MATKPDCIYYDWGDTAPREYGAFCKKTESCLNKNTCENCNSYFKRTDGDMERLTTRTRYGCKFIGLPPYSNRPEKNKLLSNAANKLAAYEDTGLTPERIRELQNAFNILFESERQKQQENEQLQAQNVVMREVLKEIFELLEEHEPIWYLRKHYNLITAALSDTPADYHNPADVAVLKQARAALKECAGISSFDGLYRVASIAEDAIQAIDEIDELEGSEWER